jgi:serine/threonine protein kinase
MSTSDLAADEPRPSAEDFLRNVLRSGLLDREQLQASLRAVPLAERGDPHALASYLVRTGKLTRFQADKLLRGMSQGMIIGPFRLLAPLGKGGMGTVFLVRDQRSDHLVALKVLPPRLARTEERMLVRFRREMEMSQRVAHPHLAWTYEVGEFRGAHYIAMEYIPGRTLSRLVTEEGPLPLPRAARLLAEVAAALEHAHKQGLIHRDLKPSNIQVTPRDHAKVLDLGLALSHGETGDALIVGGQGYIVGTMDYIAPEQTLDAVKVDARSDIYSLGCTLYFALSGQPPFPGGTSREKVMRHRNEKPTALADLVPSMPGGFVALVERMMAKDPANRPPSAAIVEAELRAWAAGEVVQPLDRAEDVTFDESQLMRQVPGASEYSLVHLPAVEGGEKHADAPEVARSAAQRLPAWLLPFLAIGITLLLTVGMLLGFMAWLGGAAGRH